MDDAIVVHRTGETKMITLKDIPSLKTAELVVAYNKLTGKNIKKFSSRTAGEKQLAALLKDAPKPVEKKQPAAKPAPKTDLEKRAAEQLLADYKAGKCACPHCGAEADVTPAGKEGTIAGDERSFCHNCNTEFWNESGKAHNRRKPGGDLGRGIAASWKVKSIAEARSKRDAVSVDGVEYRSTLAAFKELRLPQEKHIRFRIELKAKGKMVFDTGKKQYAFKIVKKSA